MPTVRECTTDTVTGYLAADHGRLKAILDDVARMVDDGELERADHTYVAFYEGLHRHIRIEEELLFPLFERTVAPHGPTDVMRAEHEAIRAALETVRAALDKGDRAAALQGLGDLDRVLPDHDRKEEGVLYPAIDRALREPDRRELVDKMRAFA